MQLKGLSEEIWKKKYKHETDNNIQDTWMRVATAVASVESDPEVWRQEFYNLLEGFKFIPGGRITAGAGTLNNYLLNCAVLPVGDSIDDIYETIKQSAKLAKSNYGVGFCFSDIRPKDDVLSKGGTASGPVSFMKVFDASGSVIQTGGARRAAQIGILRVDHPDIFEFIDAKRQPGVLTQFNISVGITKKFINAVKTDSLFDLVFRGKVYKTVKAKEIWNKLIYSGYHYNDPGIFFIDEVNEFNNGYYMYDIAATNPCGEIPLPPYGVCDLGSLNLTQFVLDPFADYTNWLDNFDWNAYTDSVIVATRFLDNVLTLSDYPIQEMKERAQGDRRIGLCAVGGLGSFLAMMKVPYDSPLALEIAESIQEHATKTAYIASIDLAEEKGAFPNYNAEKFIEANFVKRLGLDITHSGKLLTTGIRNLALITIPPIGTGSILAKYISNGLEPLFMVEYNRNVRQPDGSNRVEPVEDYAWGLWKKDRQLDSFGNYIGLTPDYFKTAMEISPKAHVDMQATLQFWIDGSISKTANIPADYSIEEYENLFFYAIEMGCKGFTTFRDGTREGVLVARDAKEGVLTSPVSAAEPVKTIRPRVLDGKTYQIKEENNHRTYCTINYIEENGTKKPWEIFLFSSSRNHEFYSAIGRLSSRIMRKTGDYQSVIDELKEIGGDNGYLTPEYGFVQSKSQHIGFILEEFVASLHNGTAKEVELLECPDCHEISYTKEGGCGKCLSCGYSTCA